MMANGNLSGATSGLTRERAMSQATNKRRSLAIQSMTSETVDIMQNQQLRSKPAIEIYRPPNIRTDGSFQNKLNVNAPEFKLKYDEPITFPQFIQHSKSSGNIQQQIQLAAARRHATQMLNATSNQPIMFSHPFDVLNAKADERTPLSDRVQTNSAPKVKFILDQTNKQNHQNGANTNSLQRSKSMSSADALARGIVGLGLGCANESNEIGSFTPEIQAIVDQALIDPNKLNTRTLMVLANQIMQRAVEGRRFALPASRFCIAIIAKEQKETFLEALLNTCRQWYQMRDKADFLGAPQKIKNSARPRFTAFMAFLTEMFCQLKRRQLQLRTKCDGVSPPIVLLNLLSKCCEDCVLPPVRSLSEIECLFYVMTCVGKDIETHLPQQLEILLAMIRDAFLNSNASAPTIRRTLLQLIELQASQWQLPGNTVLYYYPTTKAN